MTPPDIPAWLWLIVAALGGWLASEAWPFLRAEWSANARLRREQELRRIRENEERFVSALERIAETQSRMEHILERMEQMSDSYLRAMVTTSMQIDEMRRILRSLETTMLLRDRGAGQD